MKISKKEIEEEEIYLMKKKIEQIQLQNQVYIMDYFLIKMKIIIILIVIIMIKIMKIISEDFLLVILIMEIIMKMKLSIIMMNKVKKLKKKWII